MDSPFTLFFLMFRSRRPSRVSEMKAVKNAFWLSSAYDALTFFGTVVTPHRYLADALNDSSEQTLRQIAVIRNHERIHLYQARSTGDSWLLFYLRYLWYSLCLLPAQWRGKGSAYRLNPFEIEAYRHERNLHYLDGKDEGTNEWRRYAAMTIEERKRQ